MTYADTVYGDDGDGSEDPYGSEDGPAAPDSERTFAALPPARGGAFARTWWGVRWLKALEDTVLDAEQLRRGRKFARQGAVGAVSVRPGRITAVVREADGTPQRADVLVREFTEPEWERLLEVAGREAGHVAALLDGDMPPALVEDAESAGVELLPGIGDLDGTCDCGAWDHCQHTAALSYQMARLLDQDPFALLLLRGRSERRFLGALGMRGAGAAPGGSAEALSEEGEGEEDGTSTARRPASVPADGAFAAASALPPPPALPEPVAEGPAALSLEGGTPPAAPGLDLPALEFLATDASARARRMLREAMPSPNPGVHTAAGTPVALTRRQDAVRLAARRPGERIAERLAAGCGLAPGQMQLAVRAWESGGIDGLSVWEEPWTPDDGTLARLGARFAAALAETAGAAAARTQADAEGEAEPSPTGARRDAAGDLHVSANRWSTPDGTVQLRYGRDGRWWPYRRTADGSWCPAGGPEREASAALAVAYDREAPYDDGPGRDERS